MNCRCIGFLHDRALDVGDYVRYNGHIAQVTESRTDRSRSDWPVHTLRIEGGAILSMLVDCDRVELVPDPRAENYPIPDSLRAEVESLQARLRQVVRPGERFIIDGVEHVAGSIIADDLTDDGALPGETTEERVVRQREASARWIQGIRERPANWAEGVIDNDHRALAAAQRLAEGAVEEVTSEALEFTREGVEEWGRRQGDEITVDVGAPNRDYIDVTAHRDAFESVSRVSMFALHSARDPFLLLRTASEAALQAVQGMARSLRDVNEQEQIVTQDINFEPRFLSAEGAAGRLRSMASDMRMFQAQYTNRPGFIGVIDDGAGNGLGTSTAREIVDEEDEVTEYGPGGHDFEDERGW